MNHHLLRALIGATSNLNRWRRTGSRGASLVEYALLLAFIAMAAVGALAFLGGKPPIPLSTAGSTLGS